MATAFQRNAFQNNAFQIDPLPTGGSIPGTGGWGAGLFQPTWRKLLERKGYRPEPESRRRREIAALEAALQAAWEKLYPLPVVEAVQQVVPEIALPDVPKVNWDAIEASQRYFDKTKGQLEAALLTLNKILADREERERDEDDIEAILMLMQ